VFRLSIIGPQDLVDKSYKIAQEFNVIKPLKLPYKEKLGSNLDQAVELVKEYEDQTDGYLFTGPIPYYRMIKDNVTKKYLFYYPILGTALYKALFVMRVHKNIDVTNVSIDSLGEEDIYSNYKELGLDYSHTYINKTELAEYSHNQYVNFHKKLYESNKTCGAITGVKSVYSALKQYNIPVIRIIPTVYAMKRTFQFILNVREINLAESNQIIIQVISISRYSMSDKTLSAIEKKQKYLALHQELLNFSRNYLASVLPTEDNEFIILITKGTLKDYTNNYTKIPMIDKIEKKLSIAINVGIGMGTNAIEAEENARQALELAKESKERVAYLINSKKEVIGPIRKGEDLKYNLKSNNKKLVKVSEKTNLSITKLTQIKNILEKLQRDNFTAQDLKKYLKVSLRTSNRTINKLIKGDACEKVGVEQPGDRGRPRNVYKLNF